MRALRPALMLFAVCAAAIGAEAAEFGVARPGGAYATMAVADADACAQQCATDGLCMAWTFRAGACELKAVTPDPVAEPGAVSGVADRAPAFAQRTELPAPAEKPAFEPTPELLVAALAAPTALADGDGLLGGPTGDDPYIRLRSAP